MALQAGIRLGSHDILEPIGAGGRGDSEQTLPCAGFLVLGIYRDHDFTPDGERWVMVFPAAQAESAQSSRDRNHIVPNWFEHLKERLPRQGRFP